MKEDPIFLQPATSRWVFFLSLFELVYFGLLHLLYIMDIRSVILGVVAEMITIPLIVLVLLLAAVSVILLVKQRPGLFSYPVFSLVILSMVVYLILR
jgi:hypothetical protein